MNHDDPIKSLLESSAFRDSIQLALGLSSEGRFTFRPWERGMSKVGYLVTEEESGRQFMVKEIRFIDAAESARRMRGFLERFKKRGGHFGGYDEEEDEDLETNNSTTPEMASYELKTLDEIRKSNEFTHFPRPLGIFAYAHPVEGEIVRPGMTIERKFAERMAEQGKGVSFFIAEEFIKGRAPREDELKKAEAIRAEGVRTNPRMWLTVDVANNDVIVQDDGAIKFIDVGHFDPENEHDPEQAQIREFMRQEQKRGRGRLNY